MAELDLAEESTTNSFHNQPKFIFNQTLQRDLKQQSFIERIKRAQPQRSDFKIKLFKVEMDLPYFNEECSNSEFIIKNLTNIGLSPQTMKFLTSKAEFPITEEDQFESQYFNHNNNVNHKTIKENNSPSNIQYSNTSQQSLQNEEQGQHLIEIKKRRSNFEGCFENQFTLMESQYEIFKIQSQIQAENQQEKQRVLRQSDIDLYDNDERNRSNSSNNDNHNIRSSKNHNKEKKNEEEEENKSKYKKFNTHNNTEEEIKECKSSSQNSKTDQGQYSLSNEELKQLSERSENVQMKNNSRKMYLVKPQSMFLLNEMNKADQDQTISNKRKSQSSILYDNRRCSSKNKMKNDSLEERESEIDSSRCQINFYQNVTKQENQQIDNYDSEEPKSESQNLQQFQSVISLQDFEQSKSNTILQSPSQKSNYLYQDNHSSPLLCQLNKESLTEQQREQQKHQYQQQQQKQQQQELKQFLQEKQSQQQQEQKQQQQSYEMWQENFSKELRNQPVEIPEQSITLDCKIPKQFQAQEQSPLFIDESTLNNIDYKQEQQKSNFKSNNNFNKSLIIEKQQKYKSHNEQCKSMSEINANYNPSHQFNNQKCIAKIQQTFLKNQKNQINQNQITRTFSAYFQQKDNHISVNKNNGFPFKTTSSSQDYPSIQNSSQNGNMIGFDNKKQLDDQSPSNYFDVSENPSLIQLNNIIQQGEYKFSEQFPNFEKNYLHSCSSSTLKEIDIPLNNSIHLSTKINFDYSIYNKLEQIQMEPHAKQNLRTSRMIKLSIINPKADQVGNRQSQYIIKQNSPRLLKQISNIPNTSTENLLNYSMPFLKQDKNQSFSSSLYSLHSNSEQTHKHLIPSEQMKYEGQIDLQGNKHGYGILKCAKTGKIFFHGQWNQNYFHGQGFLQNIQEQPLIGNLDFTDFNHLGKRWKTYEGQFENGQRHGYGTLVLSNFEKFCGQFSFGKINGIGVFYRNNDCYPLIGKWVQNKLVVLNEKG